MVPINLLGPNHCFSSCQCDGVRTYSHAGWCQAQVRVDAWVLQVARGSTAVPTPRGIVHGGAPVTSCTCVHTYHVGRGTGGGPRLQLETICRCVLCWREAPWCWRWYGGTLQLAQAHALKKACIHARTVAPAKGSLGRNHTRTWAACCALDNVGSVNSSAAAHCQSMLRSASACTPTRPSSRGPLALVAAALAAAGQCRHFP